MAANKDGNIEYKKKDHELLLIPINSPRSDKGMWFGNFLKAEKGEAGCNSQGFVA